MDPLVASKKFLCKNQTPPPSSSSSSSSPNVAMNEGGTREGGGGGETNVDDDDDGNKLLSTIRCEHISSGMWDDHLVVALPAPAYDNEM